MSAEFMGREVALAKPFVSVVVPVFNGAEHLSACLDALLASSYASCELILVDDASTDESGTIGLKKGVHVIPQPRRSGPAAARNCGARAAKGDVLLFIDADVLVRTNTIARVAETFAEHSAVAAVFGSYDKEPRARSFVSQYKNLHHHFVHQHSRSDAATFWAGCGAIRRNVFETLGGFDAERYPEPSIEDIELGYRLHRAGYHIRLDKELQVKHLKQWTLTSLIRADVLYRAVPWTLLLLESREVINDLNLRTADRICAVLTGLSLLLLVCALFAPPLLLVAVLCWAAIVLLNSELYCFFVRERGFAFAASALPMHLMYYLYSGVTFALCWGAHITGFKALTRSNVSAPRA